MDHEHVRVGFGRGGTGASSNNNNNKHGEEDMDDLRRGPWTVEEDFTLINYVAHHGEGRWNSLARCAGLKRTGKSCRLRWLNYLRPDVRRGNITLEEQLMILELHSRWGNRWSKIAQHLPGRTDNEIKNYWRTRVQKHAKQLKCDVNSKQFKDTMRYLWMPRLVERIQAAAAAPGTTSVGPTSSSASATTTYAQNHVVHHQTNPNICTNEFVPIIQLGHTNNNNNNNPTMSFTPENSSTGASSDNSFGTQVSPVSDCCYNYLVYNNQNGNATTTTNQDYYQVNNNQSSSSSNQLGYGESLLLTSPTGYFNHGGLDFQPMDQQNSQWNMDGGDVSDSLWNVEDVWFLQQQLNNNVV